MMEIKTKIESRSALSKTLVSESVVVPGFVINGVSVGNPVGSFTTRAFAVASAVSSAVCSMVGSVVGSAVGSIVGSVVVTESVIVGVSVGITVGTR